MSAERASVKASLGRSVNDDYETQAFLLPNTMTVPSGWSSVAGHGRAAGGHGCIDVMEEEEI